MEIDGVFVAFPSADNTELAHLQQSCGWPGILISGPQQSPRIFLSAQHNLSARAARDFALEGQSTGGDRREGLLQGKGIPEPLLLVRHAGLGVMDDLCRDTLALTETDWNNDGPYDRLPVTLNFAGTLAIIVKRMPRLEPHSYPARLFM